MANPEDKYPENVDGPFYVNDTCIACEVCESEAPDNYKMTDDGDHAYVYKQPETDDDKDSCLDALSSCPVDAIGDDG